MRYAAEMNSTLLSLAGILGFTAVAAGAFGAHALSDSMSAERMETYQMATRYHLIHAVLLAVVALHSERFRPGLARFIGGTLVGGIIVFAGSLYILCLTDVGRWGAVTPFGGLLLLAAWGGIVAAGIRARRPG